MNQESNELFQEPEENLFQEETLFTDENKTDSSPARTTAEVWEILIVDDEEDVHQITHFVLDDYVFQGKPLKLTSAYSAEEAKQLIQFQLQPALILLDVVMETNDAGLKLVQYIREIQQNHFVRIILRTGQPGYAPEKEIILKYDINDYKNKTELTDQKLFTVITSSLRSYSDIMTIESYRQTLEQRVAERTSELSQKNQELLKLNQEKNEFLGIAAHDLKNPLSAIQALANLIQTSFENFPKDKIIEFARMIELSSQNMFDLIKNLLDVNAIESGKMNLSLEAFDTTPVIQSLLHRHRESARSKNISLNFEHSAEKYYIFADRLATSQILDNLISNAIKYSPRGKKVQIRLNQNDSHVHFEIQDEGPGLSEKDQLKLFGKFARLSPRPTGNEHSTGLGLFITKKLVEAMNGKVTCQTDLGRGATFTVAFPLPY